MIKNPQTYGETYVRPHHVGRSSPLRQETYLRWGRFSRLMVGGLRATYGERA